MSLFALFGIECGIEGVPAWGKVVLFPITPDVRRQYGLVPLIDVIAEVTLTNFRHEGRLVMFGGNAEVLEVKS